MGRRLVDFTPGMGARGGRWRAGTSLLLALLAVAATAEEPADARPSMPTPPFEGVVEATVTDTLEVFGGATPSLTEVRKSARAWIGPQGQRVELVEGGALHVALQRAGAPPCTIASGERACVPLPEGKEQPRDWVVARKGSDVVEGTPCERVRLDAPGGPRIDLCVTRELGPGGIWLREALQMYWGSRSLEKALAAAGVGDFPLSVSTWAGRPGRELRVTGVRRTAVDPSRFEPPPGPGPRP